MLVCLRGQRRCSLRGRRMYVLYYEGEYESFYFKRGGEETCFLSVQILIEVSVK
jgi:hypothetical protein